MTILTNSEYKVTDILPVNDEIIMFRGDCANLRDCECFVTASCSHRSFANVIIAAYTTAQARLKLYSYLERLDRRVLYYDTYVYQ